ncbi:50S ribosomal protein L9 [Syntrophus aciditrophicus]|uniref:Large ribosomal subunit protein bL9 n=1 Tax=Syntrophus aciditrophicus (strain SB) TaxID=56780 RepID=RL9_SYNAS|nr:50S ribosomal protein L9 [Syntrophus aciditrophicus]Q2LUJ5.1 RecName: Full=Large ribosomal subunit protein bL9; AltName: Full=50S ribosomal protein L9 [Syntrophus aciditrophicus SB]ABC77757.1 LSU ribosomal protein L9P [Syntrophus aciditrophicus SB]OPY17340.1 MAG: 50S ribosomal protein L9 [Syntrophus sp. PtaB.Bin075]
MKIILKENFETLGKAGEIVKVADGYARNFLIPKGIAAEANLRNIKALEHDKQNIVRKAEKERKRHESLAASLSGVTCTIARRVGEQDKLFGSVTAMDIEEALLAQNVKIDRKSIVLDEPIKAIGEFPIVIKLGAGVTAEIKVNVVPEQA